MGVGGAIVRRMSPTTAGFIVVLAAVLVVVWRRRQRRRSRPWIAKLREAVKERPVDIRPTDMRPANTIQPLRPSTTPKDQDKKDVGKRTKERRKRGKEKRPVSQSQPHLIPLPLSPPVSPMTSELAIPPLELSTPTEMAPSTSKPKLPAFPPASPLPPSLARKPPPVRLSSINASGSLNRKPSAEIEFPKDDRPKPSRKQTDGRKDRSRKTSGTPESTQIASLKGALEAARLREEEVAEERKVWAKKERELQTQVNQLSHQLHALTIAFATGGGQGFPPYGYGYGTDPSVGKLDSTDTPDHVAPRTPSGPYPAMYFPYPQYPPFMSAPPQAHAPSMTPQHGAPMTPHGPMTPQAHGPMPSPTPMMSPPMSPPQQPPYLSAPWMYRGASPMHHGPISPMNPVPMNGMSSPITGFNGMPGRHFYTGSPRRSSRPRRQGTGTPSTPSVGSVDDAVPLPDASWPSAGSSRKGSSDDWAPPLVTLPLPTARDTLPLPTSQPLPLPTSRDEYVPPRDDYLPLREDYVPIPPPPSGTKREREPETDDDECSSSDEEDSVIFEDGSMTESLNLSLRGEKGEVVRAVRIVGEQDVM